MKKLIIILAVLLAAMPAFSSESAVIKKVSGRVQMQLPGGSWQNASAGDTLPGGASISTGFNSSAVLEAGASELTVDALTRVKLDQLLQEQNTQTTALTLRVGKVKAEVKRDTGLSHNFTLRSPSSTAAVRGTKFTYNGRTVDVDDGVVAFFANALIREMLVSEGESSTLSDSGKPTDPYNERLKNSSTEGSTVKQEASAGPDGRPPSAGGVAPTADFYGSITITVQE